MGLKYYSNSKVEEHSKKKMLLSWLGNGWNDLEEEPEQANFQKELIQKNLLYVVYPPNGLRYGHLKKITKHYTYIEKIVKNDHGLQKAI